MDRPHGGDQLPIGGRPLLHHPGTVLATAVEDPREPFRGVVLAQDHDAHVGMGGGEELRDAYALVRPSRRHPDIRDHHIWPERLNRGQERRLVVGKRNEIDLGRLMEDLRQDVPDCVGIIGEHDPYGQRPG